MKRTIVFALALIPFLSIAQYKNSFPTPNAASLGLYGEIPVNHFTGLPQIEIPLYEYKSRDISVPLSLTYHGANIKPSDHASWVGLGWSLQCGGVITRSVNDIQDEFIYYDQPGTGSYLGKEKKGFFFNYNVLGNANWNGSTMYDEANVLFATGVLDQTTYLNLIYRADKAPDDFSFNFLGMSGTMYMGQDGQWKLKTKQGLSFKVSFTMGNYRVVEPTSFPFNPPGSLIKNCITNFVLTGADGTEYTFGGTNESIEFIRQGYGQPTSGCRDGGTIPTSWYLTKIKSVSGDEINFEYTRDGYQIHNNPAGIGYTFACPVCTPGAGYSNGSGVTQKDQLSILDGVTLSKITGANGSIVFDKAKARILDFAINNIYDIPSSTVQMFEAYGYEVFNGNITSGAYSIASTQSTFMQLNNIVVKDNNNNVLKTVALTYNTGSNTTQINNRLFLLSLVMKGSDGVAASPYVFTYNNMNALAGVPYETNKVDHWGYYNGVDPLTGLTFMPANIAYTPGQYVSFDGTGYAANMFNTAFKTTYTNNRAPVETAMKSAILTNMKYPTGGSTDFVWEQNSYYKYINQTPVGGAPSIVINTLTNTAFGAGLRIKQINSQAGFNSPVVTKNYNYYQDYINHTNYNSTGVLNSAPPNYFDNYSSPGNYYYDIWSNNNRTTLHYTNGSPITYTKVQEVDSDGGFTQYTFSNHDNGYLDKLPVTSYFYDYGNATLQEYHTNSLELERGLLLEKLVYDQNFLLLNKTTNVYNDDVNRYNENVRRYYFESKFVLTGTIINYAAGSAVPGGPAFMGANLYALNNYTFFPFLKSETNISYDQAGGNALTIAKTYTYDAYRNKKTETVTSSQNEQLLTTYYYANDNITGLSATAVNAKNAMVTKNMVSQVIEKTVSRAASPVESRRTEYQQYENINQFIVPYNSYKSVNGNTPDLDVQYKNFDTKGNIVEYINRDGVPESFEFGYNQVYPIAKVVNAENTLKSVIVNTPGTTTSSASLFTGSGGAYATLNTSITNANAGNITLSLSGTTPPSGVLLNVSYSLTGPTTRSGSLCYGGSGTTCVVPNSNTSIVLTSMPAGTYTLTATVSTSFTSYSVGVTFNYTYQVINTTTNYSGIKEFYCQGFEESATAATANPYSGKKYYLGDFTVPYVKPNTKTYKVNYHYLETGTGIWRNKTVTFTNNMLLSDGDAIDDVRVYPVDALMTTYTAEPLVGMTSETDPNGKTMFYQYDAQKRLSLVRDQDGNIIKKICYNYAGQPEDCYGQAYYNKALSQVFTRNNCAANYTGSAVTYTVPANTYVSYVSETAAQAMAQNDINTNGQNYANANGTCTAAVAITGITVFSYGLPNGNGTITAPAGLTVRVNLSASGQGGYSYSISVNVPGVTITGNTSVTNGSTFFTFVMPASGSVNWSATFSAPNSAGSGSVSVQ